MKTSYYWRCSLKLNMSENILQGIYFSLFLVVPVFQSEKNISE